jgi:hypothetical protein
MDGADDRDGACRGQINGLDKTVDEPVSESGSCEPFRILDAPYTRPDSKAIPASSNAFVTAPLQSTNRPLPTAADRGVTFKDCLEVRFGHIAASPFVK